MKQDLVLIQGSRQMQHLQKYFAYLWVDDKKEEL